MTITTLILLLATGILAAVTAVNISGNQDVFKAGHTYIFLANNGKYLSRIRRGVVDHIEAEKISIDYFCRFRASIMGDGKVAFQGDDGNWDYLSRITRFSNQNIEAAKKAIDIHSMFDVEVVTPGPWNGAQYVHLKADNGKYWGIVERRPYSRQNIEAYYDSNLNETATRFIVLEAQ